MFRIFDIKTSSRNDFIDISTDVHNFVRESNVESGICLVYVPHTTASVFINENADPDVVLDIKNHLEKLVPWVNNYLHIEGNASAHIKSLIVGNSVYIPILNGKLQLGTWQGIFFAEFDGPRNRKYYVKILRG